MNNQAHAKTRSACPLNIEKDHRMHKAIVRSAKSLPIPGLLDKIKSMPKMGLIKDPNIDE
jgi:hypothetical protein